MQSINTILLNKFSFIFFLLISTSFLSVSLGARPLESSKKFATHHVDAIHEEIRTEKSNNERALERIHERLLRVNTKDYGRYDPAPTFVKPPFKLIPN